MYGFGLFAPHISKEEKLREITLAYQFMLPTPPFGFSRFLRESRLSERMPTARRTTRVDTCGTQ